jgi:3-hydroxyacyl-CoA dehydrogenase/3-hydroxy-2-methylbutyryl-CoA dehydrogenase
VYKRPVCAKWSVSNEGTKLGMRCGAGEIMSFPPEDSTQKLTDRRSSPPATYTRPFEQEKNKPTMKIPGRVFVVTGGASGLGEGTCRMITANGGKVVILDVQDKKAHAVVASLPSNSAYFIKMDATKEESIEAAITAAGAKWGRIDGCVNCAGVGMGKSTVNRKGVPHSMKSFEFIIRLNLLGTFSVASKCAAWMVKNDPDENGERGTIINVASVAATDGQNGQAAYSASKAGVVGMALPMAR